MPDTRPMHCRDQAYDYSRLDVDETVSIIAEFNGKAFYDIQLTLMSIVEHTPYDLYNEILVLDDGTMDSTIERALSSFLSNPKFNKVNLKLQLNVWYWVADTSLLVFTGITKSAI